MRIAFSHVVWYDHVLWNRGRLVERWISRISHKLVASMKTEAPVNKRPKRVGQPGELKASISRRSYTRLGPRSRQFTIGMKGYARFVVNGTTGPITSTSGRRMPLPGGTAYDSPRLPRGADGTQYARFVAGQRKNDFVGRGWTQVATVHPSLRGKLRYD